MRFVERERDKGLLTKDRDGARARASIHVGRLLHLLHRGQVCSERVAECLYASVGECELQSWGGGCRMAVETGGDEKGAGCCARVGVRRR